jgi:cytochrome c-type biogenesis protein CcmH
MSLFLVLAVAMLVAACAFVLVPLIRRGPEPAPERSAVNLAVLRDAAAELEVDRAQGRLSAHQYDSARAELEGRVLEEAAPAASRPVSNRPGIATTVILAAGLPIAAAALYLTLGTPAALDPALLQQASGASESQRAVSPQDIETMIARVREKLAREPDNLEGWVVLARTLYVLDRGKEASEAFERAVALAPNDASLIADWADAAGMAQGRSLAGPPEALIARALAADPGQWKANALAGSLAFERKQYAQAIEHWQKVKSAVPADSPVAQSIEASLAEARRLAGVAPAAAPSLAASGPPPGEAGTPAPVSVAGTVTLEPASGAAPDDTVFVYARAAHGPRMPLALVRRQVKDLPLDFRLDDSMAMLPTAKLSDHREVIVTARISKSGSATPQPGDIEVDSAPVKVGTGGLKLVLRR